MDIQGIREALHREPFEPFSIRMADGRSLPVSHPDFVALGPRRIFVVAEDSWSVIEPLLIVSLDMAAIPRVPQTRRPDLPNEIAGVNAGLCVEFTEKPPVVLSLPPGVARLDRRSSRPA